MDGWIKFMTFRLEQSLNVTNVWFKNSLKDASYPIIAF